jgi:hypothetical protein
MKTNERIINSDRPVSQSEGDVNSVSGLASAVTPAIEAILKQQAQPSTDALIGWQNRVRRFSAFPHPSPFNAQEETAPVTLPPAPLGKQAKQEAGT